MTQDLKMNRVTSKRREKKLRKRAWKGLPRIHFPHHHYMIPHAFHGTFAREELRVCFGGWKALIRVLSHKDL